MSFEEIQLFFDELKLRIISIAFVTVKFLKKSKLKRSDLFATLYV